MWGWPTIQVLNITIQDLKVKLLIPQTTCNEIKCNESKYGFRWKLETGNGL